jgi:hypothetical protein
MNTIISKIPEQWRIDITKRFKSFAWRVGMMFLAIAVDTTLQHLADFNMGASTTVIVGLALGELSKQLNKPSYDTPLEG